jgi:oligopeptide transport system permease protein
MDNRALYSEITEIPDDMFTFIQKEDKIFDKKFDTKPIGYFKDAWLRFKRNKASLAAAIIIAAIVLFGIFAPFVASYKISDSDGVYAKARPYSKLFFNLGIGFWDGSYNKTLNDKYQIYIAAIGIGAEDKDGTGASYEEGINSQWSPIVDEGEPYDKDGSRYRTSRINSYMLVGFMYQTITMSKYEEIRAYEKATGLQILYPMVNTSNEWCDSYNAEDANFWFRHAANSSPVDENGRKMSLEAVMEKGLVDNYVRDSSGNVMYYVPKDKSMIQVRVLYYNYFIYKNGYEPLHTFGADAQGYDILVRLAHGIRLSFILALCVSVINLLIGALYGAIEGYYGGWVDMLLERVSDIISGMPFIILATLFQLHLVIPGKVSTLVGLIFAFVTTGWVGMAYRVRTQFYRFKNQEYVFAARTLGAKDRRLIFKHIFPNAMGTIITTAALIIPGVIYTESILSYLGIVNFNGANQSSIGTMLSNGQGYLATDPHIILFPAIIISLLMISFNLFGNGLRDAFNPTLRGVEE